MLLIQSVLSKTTIARRSLRSYSTKKVLYEWIKEIKSNKAIEFSTAWNLRIRMAYDLDNNNGIRIRILAPESSCAKLKSTNFAMNYECDELGAIIKTFAGNKIPNDDDLVCDVEISTNHQITFNGQRSADIENITTQGFDVSCQRDIKTKNIAASLRVSLETIAGSIACKSIDSEVVRVAASQNGDVYVKKATGKKLFASTNCGTLSFGSCYADQSVFSSLGGNMVLKNIHKQAQINMDSPGDLVMTGFDGNLNVHTRNARVNIQISRLLGTSELNISGEEQTDIKLSDTVANGTNILAKANPLILSEDLECLRGQINEHGQLDSRIESKDAPNLMINCSSEMRLEKQSWIDSIVDGKR